MLVGTNILCSGYHGVVATVEQSEPAADAAQAQKDFWQHANKDKDIELQIDEYHRLLEELRAEKINLPDESVVGILIEKLLESWSAYKQQLKHKQKQLPFSDLITNIITENTNRKTIQIAKGKQMVAKENLVVSCKKRTSYYGCPDDDTFRFMASIYSHSHYNMSSSKEFPGGITNGAFWYPIYGGMQDWNYIHAGCFELTLEISDNKWPNAVELPVLWKYNKMSMVNLVASLVKDNISVSRFVVSDVKRSL
ncbi:carboxypeptidase SOL1-like isoform X2 [Senna tora]|uniref:Carboxypeptidase SOL1-like isoform X2 n=1 Tax=Senna tora TaxID=362788 RepID=A0A834TI80_9FABA|nr:carboxypeptidase SOL1-like isoform X2 [Senna tora]